MDKKIQWGMLILAVVLSILMCEAIHARSSALCNTDFIRLHVIANSDSDEDQRIKLKVRDAVLQMMDETLESGEDGNTKQNGTYAVSDIETARSYISGHLEGIRQTAEETLRSEGCGVPVTVSFGGTWIPEKTYGSITFPAGNYEAVCVRIGAAAGQNWWCVLYPPLCLIDSTSASETPEKAAQKDALLTGRYKELAEASGGSPRILHLRFKSVEQIKKWAASGKTTAKQKNTDD